MNSLPLEGDYAYEKMEEFCQLYSFDLILRAANSRQDFFNKSVTAFFEKVVDYKKYCNIQPIKLMLQMAIVQGSPLFQLIPAVINGVKEEYKEELKLFMKDRATIEFDEEAANWLYEYYEYVDDQVHGFCSGFWYNDVRPGLHQACLFVSLLVRGDLKKISYITAMVLRCPNIWNTLKMKALQTNSGHNEQLAIGAKITEPQYTAIFNRLCKDSNDDHFESHQGVFLKASICEWPDVVKKFCLAAHPDDSTSVGHYISTFNSKYQESVSLFDIRKESPGM